MKPLLVILFLLSFNLPATAWGSGCRADLNALASNSQNASDDTLKKLESLRMAEMHYELVVSALQEKIKADAFLAGALTPDQIGQLVRELVNPARRFDTAAEVVRHFISTQTKVAQEPHEDLQNLVLRTARLEIKSVNQGQLTEVTKIWTDPKTMEMSGDYLDGATVNQLLAMGQQKFSQAAATNAPFINFGIFFDGALVGMAQVAAGQEDSISLSGLNQTEQKWVSISYHLRPSVWGQGVDTEAASRLVKFAFENLHVAGIHAEATKTNTASQKVLRKLGFKELNFSDAKYFHYFIKAEMFDQRTGHTQKDAS